MRDCMQVTREIPNWTLDLTVNEARRQFNIVVSPESNHRRSRSIDTLRRINLKELASSSKSETYASHRSDRTELPATILTTALFWSCSGRPMFL